MNNSSLTRMRDRLIVILLLAFVIGSVLFGNEEIVFSGDLKIISHYKDRIKERIFCKGDVEVHYKQIKLFADFVEINTETKDVYAEGNVVIHFPEEVVSAEKIHFNLDSTEGELEKASGMVKPSVFYEAKSIKRKSDSVYSFKKAKITSCAQSIPRWNFSCSKANFKKEDYMEMWNSVLSIRKIPVFYFPYMRYPLNKEKAAGFLMPQLGFSGRKGMFYTQSFYWPIKRNMDSTLSFDYYSERGMGGGLEYRYLFSGGTGGKLNVYYFTFKDDPEMDNPPSAYIFRFAHNQPLPLAFNLIADFDYQSSFDFLREFDNNFKRAIVSNRKSQVYLSRSWSYFNMNLRASRFETYLVQSNNSIIRYNLPSIGFSSSSIKLFSPLYFSFSSNFEKWEHGWDSEYAAGNQKRSQSLSFTPELNFPFRAIPWLTLRSSFSKHFKLHFQSRDPVSNEVVNEPLLSQKYGLAASLVGPVFYKIFFGPKGEAKVKHIIEPRFTYRYESPLSYTDRIISAYGVFRYHYMNYGLTNRLLVKRGGMPRELFTFGVSQILYLNPEESPLNLYLYKGEIPKFTDIDGYLRFYPSDKYTLDLSVGFNPYVKTFSNLRAGANLGSPRDILFLRVSWFKSINPYEESAWYNRHQISGFGGFKIPQMSLEAYAQIDFNIEELKMLYTSFALVYRYQCLDFRADFKIFYFREKPETQFRISFGLGNIGKTTDFLGGMEF